ncbi:hypothetical protein ARMGADRAFT_1037954 [Armillaria gallica]|uniref:WD40 repeat-like protein n=1 Tax=Armillaria gallica TaxID=47427 RepID=A0A2H3CXX1_ARMGA|nr:hypothetical protein ARMGADRAFT_1037954 [Armillaria gallica]
MSNKYSVEKIIKSPHAAVLCLAVTEKGPDGVFLWNTKTGRQLKQPGGGGFRGDTTAMTWIHGEDDADKVLIYGTLHGYIICWKQIKNTNVHKVDTQMKLCGYVSVIIQNCDPRAIYFLPNGESQNMIVFGCHSSKIYLLRGSDGMMIETYDAGGIISHATVNTAKDVFGIDDPSEGIALYHVVDGAKVKTLPVKTMKTPWPQQVAFTQDSKIVYITVLHLQAGMN